MKNDNKSILAAQCVGSVVKHMENPVILLEFITGSFFACDYAPEDGQKDIRDLLLQFQEYILLEWLQNNNGEMVDKMECIIDPDDIHRGLIRPIQALTVAIQVYLHATGGSTASEHAAFVKGTCMLFEITNTIIEA